MKDVLIGKFDFTPANVLVLRDEQATHAGVVSAIQNHLIAKAGKDDIVVFYWSGHGSQMKDMNGDEPDGMDETLVPYDSRDPQRRVFDISDDELNGLMRQLSDKTKNVTVILDSCHSGTGLKDIPDATLRVREIKPDDRIPPPETPVYAVRQRGAASFAPETFRYALISATREKQLAFEHEVSRGREHGVLTHYLTQALRRPNLQTNRAVMDLVTSQVNAQFPNQNPQLEGANIDQYVFGDGSSLPKPYFLIPRGGSGKVPVGGGSVHGITEGSAVCRLSPAVEEIRAARTADNDD